MSANEAALVLFCKPPDQSKQRLTPELGKAAVTELAQHLLRCALEDAVAWPGPVVLSPASRAHENWARGLAPPGAAIVPQPQGNLGERLNGVDSLLRAEGHEMLLFIGMDCPLLDVAALAAAASALKQTDVALGPAADGGVVFMGNSRPWPPLAELPWSTERLGAALAAACKAAGLGIHRQGLWTDVDRASDLAPLSAALAADPRAARRQLRDWLLRGENGPSI